MNEPAPTYAQLQEENAQLKAEIERLKTKFDLYKIDLEEKILNLQKQIPTGGGVTRQRFL